jgi:hypothetical protein
VNLGFFATPEELVAWVSDWVRRYALFQLFVTPPPSPELIGRVDWDDPEQVLGVLSRSRFLYLNRTPIETNVPTMNHIPIRNPDHLRLILPLKHGGRGLGWCHLDSVSRVPETRKVWLAIRDMVTGTTRPGVWFVTPGDPEPYLSEAARYTDGTVRLLAQGTRIF